MPSLSQLAAAVGLCLTGASAFSAEQMLHAAAAANSSSMAKILAPTQDPFYTAPANFAQAAPGAILRARAADPSIVSSTANASAAYQLLFRTTDSLYQPSWAVTTLFVPKNTSSNTSLLSYQIPYDSADVNASPSYTLASGGYNDISAGLGQGWWVNVPDYEGPKGSFTAGVQSGHATLDSVRAVLHSGYGLSATPRYALWGYSGGALASEWAAELAVQYAPELNFSGAALGGLTPNVTSVLFAVNGGLEAGLIPAGILGLASQFPQLESFLKQELNPSGPYNATTFFNARNQSLVGTIGTFLNQDITKYFKRGVAALQAPVAQYVINRDGIMGYHGVPQMPVFAYKAIGDEISPTRDTDALVQRYCGVGANIWYQRNTVGNHVTESTNGDARAFAFVKSVLAGSYNQTMGCRIQNVTVNASS